MGNLSISEAPDGSMIKEPGHKIIVKYLFNIYIDRRLTPQFKTPDVLNACEKYHRERQ